MLYFKIVAYFVEKKGEAFFFCFILKIINCTVGVVVGRYIGPEP